MNQPEWWLLFFVAIVIGYIMGRRDGRRRRRRSEENLSRDYIRGLNYFLNEQPDKAIEIFVKSLAVSEHTLETHLALARVFRRRGELDRAGTGFSVRRHARSCRRYLAAAAGAGQPP